VEQRQLLCDIRREHPSASVPLILRTLQTDGRLDKGAVSASTVRRLFAEGGLDRIPMRDGTGAKTRLRWQAERPGALWQGDVCYGPAILVGGVSKPPLGPNRWRVSRDSSSSGSLRWRL
jgi:putative transposase